MEVKDQDMDMAVKENHMVAQTVTEQRNTITMIVMVLIAMATDIPRKDMVMEITMEKACHMAIVMEDDLHIKCFK